jgi:predicted HicB family RNase H-like nuclease
METREKRDGLVQLNVMVPVEVRQDLKILATLEGLSMNEFCARELQTLCVALLSGATPKSLLRKE